MGNFNILKLAAFGLDQIFDFKNPVLPIFEMIISIYDKLFGEIIIQYLFFRPSDFPDLSTVLNIIKPVMLTAAGSLAFALWLIDLMVQVTEIRQDNSFKRMGISLAKIAITMILIVNAYTLVELVAGIFRSIMEGIAAVIVKVSNNFGTPGGFYTENIRNYLDDISVLNGVPIIIITFLAIIVSFISVWSIAKSFLLRFFEVVLLYIFAPFLFACLIGEKTSSIALSYIKEYSFKYLESVAIIIMLVIAGPIIEGFINGMTGIVTGGNASGITGAIQALFSMLLYLGLLASLITHAEKTFSRIR